MIVDGRRLASERTEEIRESRVRFGALSLGVVIATTSPVTQSYVGIKKRAARALDIDVVEYHVSDDATLDDVVDAVKKASVHDGVILQLPLPPGIDVDVAKNAIPAHLDVDVLSDEAFKLFVGARLKNGVSEPRGESPEARDRVGVRGVLEVQRGRDERPVAQELASQTGRDFQTSSNEFPAIPPVPAAMWYILKRNNVTVEGANVVLIGGGRLVGRPANILFKRLGANVTVLVKGDNVAEATKNADIIISGAGAPALIKPDMVKEGVVIIDGGTSESGGIVVGDADPLCAEKASVFTPVPGGVGPIAVTEIFANLVALKAKYL
ncbi:bifunctional 5,10-methylenetetrahydrofolate dehydrogenase/5,10-methenyltetrahydrofolate cyclohydrolase [Patescibacteria group bacterium]|nr:MAG: bifunctional 5,10-methylenetetrahydrofolate dehydrogenase/5,10-methenyltetrahydrofolate cyclohydrolase [Patescibacteria group bacterium]